jgi:ATP-binding cassette subfamily F protein uup
VAEVIKLSNGSEVTASQLLNQFLFPPKMQFTLVGKLSGGEKRRLQLLRVLMQNPNFLILDEPTNDLDLMTLNVLEDYLDSFEGCLMIVSHDRYFMDRLTDHLFVFEGNGKIRDFPGNYTDLRLSGTMPKSGSTKEEKSTAVAEKPKAEAKPTEKRKLSFAEKKELEKLGVEIANLEKQKANLTTRMQAETAYEAIQKVADELQRVMASLSEKELRWLELSELEG